MGNLEEMDEFLEAYKLPRLSQEGKKQYIKRPKINKEIE